MLCCPILEQAVEGLDINSQHHLLPSRLYCRERIVASVLSRDPQVQGQTPVKSQSSYRPVDPLTFCLNTCDLNKVVQSLGTETCRRARIGGPFLGAATVTNLESL